MRAVSPSASLTTIRRPNLHAAQRQVINGARRYTVVACGRRWGKTHLAVRLLMQTALEGKPAGYFTPTYKLLLEVWRDVASRLSSVTKRANASERRIELITGGVIEFWTLEDGDAGRSRKYARAVVDEAGLVAELGAIWNAAIRPTLADLHGDAWFLGTPKGRNFFWQCYQRAQTDPEWAAFTMPTRANPYIAPGEIAAMREAMPERLYQQEIEATFLDDGGGVFRNVRACVGTADRSTQACVIGVDWGRTADATVFVAVDPATRGVIALERLTRVEFAHQRAALLAFWQRHGRGPVIAEANSIGQPNIEALVRDGIPVQPFITTNATKAQIIDALVLAFEQQAITLPADEWLLGELEAYESERLPSGLLRYSAPEGMHDDGVMALALAWSGVNHGISSIMQHYAARAAALKAAQL